MSLKNPGYSVTNEFIKMICSLLREFSRNTYAWRLRCGSFCYFCASRRYQLTFVELLVHCVSFPNPCLLLSRLGSLNMCPQPWCGALAVLYPYLFRNYLCLPVAVYPYLCRVHSLISSWLGVMITPCPWLSTVHNTMRKWAGATRDFSHPLVLYVVPVVCLRMSRRQTSTANNIHW